MEVQNSFVWIMNCLVQAIIYLLICQVSSTKPVFSLTSESISHWWRIASEILCPSTWGMAFLPWLLLPSALWEAPLPWVPCSCFGWQRVQEINRGIWVRQEILSFIGGLLACF